MGAGSRNETTVLDVATARPVADAAKPSNQAAQNPAQQAHAGSGGESQLSTTAQKQSPVLPGFANSCDIVQICSVPPEGLEPSTL